MKRLLIVLICIFLPINIFAYSEYVIPGGENIGLAIESKGLVIVGFYKVQGKYIGNAFLEVGDTILEIEGKEISNISEMANLIDENIKNDEVSIKILRNNKIKETKLHLIKEDGIYKTGLYIKDKVTGIGTLSYIDPETFIYGSLGHRIIMNETNNNIEIKSGELYKSYVEGLDRSVDGRVGSKSASINYSSLLGTIQKNTDVGIFGKYSEVLPSKDTLRVADFNEVQLGRAIILTTIDGENIEEFEIEIIGLEKKDIKTNKSIIFKVTDKKLIENAGGIVQGMSGSPIIQNDKIIGAVTHVVVDEVDKGYGVFIRTMLEEGEKAVD